MIVILGWLLFWFVVSITIGYAMARSNSRRSRRISVYRVGRGRRRL